MAFVATVPYADTAYADLYFAERVGSSVWDAADPADKAKALKHSTRMIDTLAFAGEKNDPDQLREFPREDDTEVPDEVSKACCEVALALLSGNTLDSIEDTANVVSEAIGDVSIAYDEDGKGKMLGEHGGLPSAEAYRLLVDWLIDDTRIHLDRAG